MKLDTAGRRLLVGLGLAALLAAPILLRAIDDGPSRVAGVHPPAHIAPAVATTPCSEVEAPPRGVEWDTSYDPGSGAVQVWFRVGSTDRHFAIDPRNDPSCAADPELGALIEHVQDAATDR